MLPDPSKGRKPHGRADAGRTNGPLRRPVNYVSDWLRQARQTDDQVFRLYVSLFLLDLTSEHGRIFNGNERPSTSNARATLRAAFEWNLAFVQR